MRNPVLRIFIFTILFVTAGIELNAGHIQDFKFRHLTKRQGLASNTVISLYRDSKGYYWISTDKGLTRFDGKDTKVYTNNPQDSGSIPENYTTSITEDCFGNLWIGTFTKGLCRYDAIHDRFISYVPDSTNPKKLNPGTITHISADVSGNIWVCVWGGGLHQVDARSGIVVNKFLHDPSNPYSLPDNRVKYFMTDSRGLQWVGCWDYDTCHSVGLLNFDKKTKQFKPIIKERLYYGDFIYHPEQMLRHIHSIFESRDGDLWIGCYLGMAHYRRKTKDFEFFYQDEHAKDAQITYQNVRCITEDENGNIWMGTLGGGLNVLDRSSGKVSVLAQNDEDPNSISDSRIKYFLNDDIGNILIATLGGGLNIYDRNNNRFHFYSKSALEIGSREYKGNISTNLRGMNLDHSGNLYYSGTFGVYKLPADGSPIQKLNRTDIISAQFGAFAAEYIEVTNDNRIFVTTHDNGIFEISPDFKITNRLKNFRINTSSSTHSGSQTGWIASEHKGIYKVDFSKDQITENLVNTTDFFCSTILTFKDKIYFTNRKGIWQFDETNGKTRQLHQAGKFDFNNIQYYGRYPSLSQDGKIYFPTVEGLFVYTVSNDQLTHYDSSNGQSLALLEGSCLDNKGNLWLYTAEKLLLFDTKDNAIIKVLTEREGLPTSEFKGPMIQSRTDGDMYLVSVDGIMYFNPSEFYQKTADVRSLITGIKVFNEEVESDTAFVSKRKFTFKHNQNYLSIRFSCPDMPLSNNVHFMYKMEGLDPQWMSSYNKFEAVYNNIPHGNYVFIIKAQNADGSWGPESRLPIEITPAWYQRAWFYILVSLAVMLLVYLVILNRTRSLKKQSQLLEEKVKRRTTELESSNNELNDTLQHLKTAQDRLLHSERLAALGQLTAGIAHEIQNPLNFVTNFAGISSSLLQELDEVKDEAEKKEIIQDLNSNLLKIQDHGRRASNIIQSMLLHSRGQAGDKQATDLGKLLQESLNLSYHGSRSQLKGFSCKMDIHIDSNLPLLEVRRQDISRVLVNLFNNAFYAMHEKQNAIAGFEPELKIDCKQSERYIEVVILDNGTGIPKALLQKIFDPFFTTKPAGRGTGLGLSMSFDLIIANDGQMNVESKEGEWTRFTILFSKQA